jgi:signal transduction histidine kinase/CheY-like chemotaxis protein
MNIFNNLNVGTKIFAGFFLILILMGIVGGLAMFQFTQIKVTVTNLADNFAKDQHLADQMVARILLTRFYANKYILGNKAEDLARFKEEFVYFEKLLAEASIEITKSERAKMLTDIKVGVQNYGENFAQVTKFIDKRHEILYKSFDVQGPLAEEKLEQLRESAFKADDAIASFYAGNAQRALLLMRLDAFKYLENGNIQWVKKFEKRYQEAQSAFQNLDRELQDPTRRQLAQIAQTTVDKYHQGFISLQTDYDKQNQIIETQLNVIGPQVRKTASKMSDSVSIDFDATNQKNRVLVDKTRWQLFITMLIALLVGISLGLFISRSITVPLAIVIDMSNKMAVGIIKQIVDVQNRAKINQLMARQDEIGSLGRAYNTLAAYFSAMINDIVLVSQGLKTGDLRVVPQAQYKGDFVQIKNSLESASSNLQLVVKDIVQVSQGLAVGDLRVMPKAEYRGDFVQIKEALETTLANQNQVIKDITQVSQGLALGNLRVMPTAEYTGDFVQIKEALETTLLYLGKVIRDIVQVSQGLAEGNNLTTKVEYRGDFNQIQNALEIAVAQLADATTKNNIQDWLKTGQAKLNVQITGEQDFVTLAKKIISFLTTYVEAEVGLFYTLTEENGQQFLQIIASYAYIDNDESPKVLVTKGLAGQAALEQKVISLTQTAEECLLVSRSGLAGALPKHVLLLPFLYENEVKGVIEIGSGTIMTDIQQSFLEQVMQNIGIAVNTAKSRTQMQTLLEQSQRQSEELQSKQAELQQTNEELQSQSEELQTQSEELQTQQEELRQTNEVLEKRTRDLEKQKLAVQGKNQALSQTQTEMEQAKLAIEAKAKELALASKYKSEFLANMSHELRTPLNSLLILAKLLTDNKSNNLTAKQIEYAATIHSAGTDLLTLINDILDLSKIEAGKIEIQWEEVSLSNLLTMVEQKFRHVAEGKKLAFHLMLAEDIPSVIYTDGQRLKQIINNLLSNAFKFTSTGEIKVMAQRPTSIPSFSALSSNVLEVTKTVAISVSDTGIGIPKDKQQVIFEAFQQADGTTNRRYGGTGLGLSISRQLARLLGGELTLVRSKDKGTTFTLYLPIGESQSKSKNLNQAPQSITQVVPKDAVAQDNQASQSIVVPKDVVAQDKFVSKATQDEVVPEKAAHQKPPITDDRNALQPSDKSILIVEDDQKFANILSDLAHSKGFKCLIAGDGISGLQIAEEYKPHAIILDVGLPELDGLSVMEKLKDNPDTRHIPVHFISAAELNMDAKKMGAIGYLTKPVSMEQLGEAFQNIEQFLTATVKNLLVITDIEWHQQKIVELVGGEHIQLQVATTTDTVCQQIRTTDYDCIILDMDIENGSGSKLIEQMQQENGTCQIPIIVYANRELTSSEEALLLRCADELPLKSVQSPERLLDEATLFLHQVEANLPADKRNMLQMVHDKTKILHQKKVLIIDDDMRNTFALATVLEDYDMEVIVGADGKEGLTVLEENDNVAIVLMDIMMPEMDGYEAIRKIREQPRYRHLPIIALTAKAMKGDRAKCIEAGANDYLAKPVDTEKLLSLMRVWLYR